jgi:hypothetical protein
MHVYTTTKKMNTLPLHTFSIQTQFVNSIVSFWGSVKWINSSKKHQFIFFFTVINDHFQHQGKYVLREKGQRQGTHVAYLKTSARFIVCKVNQWTFPLITKIQSRTQSNACMCAG